MFVSLSPAWSAGWRLSLTTFDSVSSESSLRLGTLKSPATTMKSAAGQLALRIWLVRMAASFLRVASSVVVEPDCRWTLTTCSSCVPGRSMVAHAKSRYCTWESAHSPEATIGQRLMTPLGMSAPLYGST